MALENIKGVIFDFDGTLYDMTCMPVDLVLNDIKNCLIMKADRKVRHNLKGKDFGSLEKLMDVYCSQVSDVTGVSKEKILEWYLNIYPKEMVSLLKKKYKAYEKAQEVFKTLSLSGIKFSVFSDYPMVRERMEAVGLKEIVPLCHDFYYAGDFGSFKPAPRPFLEIAFSMGLSQNECLVVGDRDDTDGEGARLCGMSFIQIEKNKKAKANAKVISGDHKIMTLEEFSILLK
mgnify:CR=1 FL=1